MTTNHPVVQGREECREAFEKWWNNRDENPRLNSIAWGSWQAAWHRAQTPREEGGRV